MQGGTIQPSPRKVRLSMMPSPRMRGEVVSTASFSHIKRRLQFLDSDDAISNEGAMLSYATDGIHSRRSLCGISEEENTEDSHSSEDAELLVSRMIELVHKEKEAAELHDAEQDVDNEEEADEVAFADMNREITEKEEILCKLKDAVKGFAVMKHEYESLVHEINNLENERHDLEAALEKAKKQEELLIAQKKPGNPVALERMRDRFLKVKEELDRMKSDRLKKESAYKLMQRESKQCETLQRELAKLKENKVALMKAQKAQSQQYQKFRKEQTQKMTQMKKSDVKKQQQMNELKSELQKKVRVLGNKDREIGRIQSKLKACEAHIKHLMANARVNRQRTIFTPSKSSGNIDDKSEEPSTKEATALFASARSILENVIEDRVEARHMKTLLVRKTAQLKDVKEELALELQEKKSLDMQLEAMEADKFNDPMAFTEDKEDALNAMRQQIRSSEAAIDRITSEQNILNADLAELSIKVGDAKDDSENTWEDICKSAISGLSQAQCQTLLWEMSFEKAELMGLVQDEQEKKNSVTDSHAAMAERLEELQEKLDQTTRAMKQQLDNAEKQRVQDVWAVLQCQDGVGPKDMATESVVLARAQELELALGDMISSEADLKAEIAELRAKNAELQKTLQEKIFTSRAGLTNKVDAEESVKCYAELDSIWSQLGTDIGDRQTVLTFIDKASTVARRDALDRAKATLSLTISALKVQEEDIKLFCGLLMTPESTFYDTSAYATAQLLTKHQVLTAAVKKAENEVVSRASTLYNLRDKLFDLTVSMGIESSELSAELRVLTLLDDAYRASGAEALTAHCISIAATLGQSNISQVDNALREMSIQRADLLSRATTLIQKITPLRSQLGYQLEDQFMELALGATYSQQTKTLAIQNIMSPKAGVLGNVNAVQCMDDILMSLVTVKTSRENCVGILLQLAETLQTYFNISLGVTASAQPCDRAYIQSMLEKFASLQLVVSNFLDSTQTNLYLRMTELGVSAEDFDNRLSLLSNTPPSTSEEINSITDINAPMIELKDLSVYIEEKWLKDAVGIIVHAFAELQNDIIFVSIHIYLIHVLLMQCLRRQLY